jgi:hypothetical protein
VLSQLEEIRKEVVRATFKVLSWHLPGGSEEMHENLTQDSRSADYEPGTSRIYIVTGDVLLHCTIETY